MDALFDPGITLIQAIQTMSPTLDVPMEVLSFLGTIEFYLILIPLLYWTMNTRLGMRVLLVLITADLVSIFFKQLLHQPRPYWVSDTVKELATESSYEIPSGHASDSLVVWGCLTYHLRRRWFWIVASAIVMLIGLSRLYLAVHFPHDVVLGWIIGAVVLFLFIKGEHWASSWLQTQTTGGLIGFGFGASVVVVLIGLLVGIVISSSPDPEIWEIYATEARSPATYFTLSGALFGAVTGYVLMRQYAHFQTGGAWVQRIGRFILGIVGVLIFWRGLGMLFALFAADETPLGYILRYIRFAVTSGWVTFGAPWVFLRVKLAEISEN